MNLPVSLMVDFFGWLTVIALVPTIALGLHVSARGRVAVPWLALATVVVGTAPAFSLSATLASYGSAGAALGTLTTFTYGFTTLLYGLIGLGILTCHGRLQPMAFAPIGAVLAGLICIVSFHQYIPPFNPGPAVTLVFATPGLALVIYGAYLWRRDGLSGALPAGNLSLRMIAVLGVVAGLGALGFTATPSGPCGATSP